MSPAQFPAVGAIVVLGVVMSIVATSVHAGFNLNPLCPAGFANFGDSLTDTGSALDAFPFFADAENSPYGETFFGQPAKRFCNGRLVPDFFSLAFEYPLLDAYFSVASFNYKNGINFANVGAPAAFSPTAISPFALTPFQTSQFIRFQNSVQNTEAQLGCFNFNLELPTSGLLQKPDWSTWLYTITAGGNDILPPIESGVSITYVNTTIVPTAVFAIIGAIQTLYQSGARKFLVFGVPAAGCSTVVITDLRNQNLRTDSLGCIIDVNSVVQNLNSQLLARIKTLRLALPDANIAYFSYYDANIEILTHPASYGFNPALTKTACCGAPGAGTLNYNPAITCGHPTLGSNNCANPDQYVIWDGVHFTEAFYRAIAYFALSGVFTDGGVNYAQICNLDFSKFGSGITFAQAYPFQTCNNLFA